MIIRSIDELGPALERQRGAHMATSMPPAGWRIERLKRLSALVRKHQGRLVEAVSADFGTRPAIQSRMELYSVAETAKFAWRRVASWMKAERVPVPLPMAALGGRAEIVKQPLGVAGIIGPWNFPYQATLAPLVAALAAGNRAMLKPSDMTPASSEALAEAIADFFPADEVAVALGDVALARAFAALPFDHLLFTGSPGVGREVMRSASDNLVPVTLELGGKCPAIIDANADIKQAARRILMGKCQNAGQICLSPDTVFVPEHDIEDFIAFARDAVSKCYGSIDDNPDYPAIIDRRNVERLTGYADEARAAGVRIERITAGGDSPAASEARKIAPAVVIDPPEDLRISREEIFGPLMVVRSYTAIAEVIAYIRARPHPLAIYYFGNDASTIRTLRASTISGGLTINDVIMHASIEGLPFGGVGNSGMGAYHGRYGFDTFTHRKAVYRQGRYSLLDLFKPPYLPRHARLLDRMLGPVDA